MIYMSFGTLWVLLGIWLAVTVCAFMLGWHGSGYTAPRAAPLPEPAPPPAPPPLPRRNRLPVAQADATAIDIQRWWPGMERAAGPSTTPLSHVEVSNWEKRIKGDTSAWLHERGMPYAPPD